MDIKIIKSRHNIVVAGHNQLWVFGRMLSDQHLQLGLVMHEADGRAADKLHHVVGARGDVMSHTATPAAGRAEIRRKNGLMIPYFAA